MIYVGLDVGSRTIAMVMLSDEVIDTCIEDTGVNPLDRCQRLLADRSYERLMVTGYGRYLVAQVLQGEVVSEITAYAVGATHLYSDTRTVIDIGGQDSKVMSISSDGAVQKFEMNDRCSAGTGKFLEIMASTLEVSVDELGDLALSASKPIQINSLCTVFAESEVVSLIAKGEESNAIALGLHEAIATRIIGMVRRTGFKERVVFAGGAALNTCLSKLIGEKLGIELTIPSQPQIIGAFGAALLTRQKHKHGCIANCQVS